ncbi:isoleucine--tRNA ligase [Candidatus Mycosynbacter amalyticus]|uniref:Isoleucine--tRNA ligase n=1 Tax=Candidatus Mycosynbacter amalyticus TaxID=2665156 RepID=A0A857MIV1_9BACT|nr:isoleucine--tRNA ligase [Candidatus Mycosynbacter amalyticus]QHN42494.1 isoleucine--tRNA ligase [Candidatus Mycosynbacter amalyticus]
MKFKANSRRRALEYEKDWVQKWKTQKTFEKSVEQRPADNAYVFYDGPPFITGVPHHGTLLSSVVKDAVPRYQTMLGKRVERVWGWDCHGLPAEVFTEKKLGIKDRRDIGTKISLEEYITTARDNMVQTSSLWNDTIDRIGRWVDMDNAYKTMDKEYMESIWWAFKELYNKGKIYEGERVLMYCTRDATPLSKAEVTMDAGAYQDVTDPSVYVKFKLTNGNTLLAWTTTPWTLPANTAVAVNKDLDYVEVKVGDEQFTVAKELVQKVLTDEKHQPLEYEVVRELKGEELVGLSYEPLFENRGEDAHKVWAADYVSAEDGSGIVHIAPAYGEEDFELAQREGIPVVHVIDENGLYSETEWRGENVWEINKTIAKMLHERGTVWKIDYIRHSYPHCHRCGTRLMYRAHPSWFFDVQGQKQLMLEKNTEQIEWFPEHLKHGRWQKNIEAAPDWNLSRDRFWATAMPVWEGKDKDGKKHQIVVGSYAELKDLSGRELDDYHRPWVDDITFEKDGIHYTRIEKVLDGWFESGSMPFAQFHYPFENKAKFEANFPGDFISEYIGQVRAWFYYLHVVGVGLFGEAPFKHVITTGVVAGNDGRKMSKSYGNYTDPNELMDKFSADSLRFLLLSSPLLSGEDFALHDKDVGDVARKLSMIWNMYDFFTMYAEVDGWEFDPTKPFTTNPEDVHNPLDKWIISRVHELNKHVSEHMDAYNLPVAMSEFLPFIEDASNWFVRRSRRRFWKSEDDGDKAEAYCTLHYVLMKLSVILAPFTPFLSEELYQNLGGGGESVHLLDWPSNYTVDQLVLDEMGTVREYVNQALSIRAKERLKIRQPLASVTVPTLGKFVNFEDILTEELNVKKVVQGGELTLDLELTPELKREGLMREVIRHIQATRKDAGLNVDDRIVLHLSTDNQELAAAIAEHEDTIRTEVLADGVSTDKLSYEKDVKVEGADLQVSLEKYSA